MEDKNLFVYANWTGNKIKTAGLTMHQNSTNNVLHFITIGHYTAVTATFKTPDGKLSDGYHMIDEGHWCHEVDGEWVFPEGHEDDIDYEVLKENADKLYHYTLQIPYKVSIMTVLGNSARLNVAFAGYTYDEESQFLKQCLTANSQIIISAATHAETLDESYSSSDVENLWKVVGMLSERVTELEQDGAYSAGSGIDISDMTISADNTIARVSALNLKANQTDVNAIEAYLQSGKLQYLSEEPTEDNIDGVKLVILDAEPTTKYNGYIYMIKE